MISKHPIFFLTQLSSPQLSLQYNNKEKGHHMKDQQELENDNPRQDTNLSQHQNESNSQTHINFLEEYSKIVGSDQKAKISALTQQLKSNDIQYNSLQDHNQYSLHLLHHSKNYRTLTVKVVLGPFSTIVKIYNQTSPSFVHQLNCLYGCCGNVYLLEWGSQEKIAVKCIQMKDQFSSIFLRTLKQYIINKIASALSVGPKIIKFQEFDLIIYQNCIEFCMEKCLLTEEYTMTQEDYLILKNKLKILHELKIVHCDIKPLNIVYSQSFRSPVFLDFGFSKILSTEPGTGVKTKFVGSLESCCKQMMKLYLTKQIGVIDLYYNDACCLQAALKSDPIRQTGNDLEEIIRFCDPTLPNFRYIKINYYLYSDQILNAKNEHLISQRHKKSSEIMSFLQTLPPTQNLRQFYFTFFHKEWQESIQFSDLVKNYTFSHRHKLQLDIKNPPSEQPKNPGILCYLIPHVFNKHFNLFELDNDLIDFSEKCIGQSNFFKNRFATIEQKYDFLLEHIGLLNQNYFVEAKKFDHSWQICNHFLSSILENKQTINDDSAKLIICFQFIIKQCLKPPLSAWKLKTFQRCINQQMTLKQLNPDIFYNYLSIIVNLSCQVEFKLNLLVSLINSLKYQIAVWGYGFIRRKKYKKSLGQHIQRVDSHYYQLQLSDEYLQKLIKLDKFLLKSLIQQTVNMDSITSIEKMFSLLKQQDQKQRIGIFNFIKIMRFFNEEKFEECRIQIEKTLSVSEIPIILKPEYFILCGVYYKLKSTKRCRQMFRFLQENMMVKKILANCRNIQMYIESMDENTLLQSFAKKVVEFKQPELFINPIFKRYYRIKGKRSLNELEKYHNLIQSITKDKELRLSLEKSSGENPTLKENLQVYSQTQKYLKGLQSQLQKDDLQCGMQSPLLFITLTCYWKINQFQLIIEELTKGRLNFTNPTQNDPQIFDFLLKAYIMTNQSQKCKSLIRSFDYNAVNKIAFIEKWIQTVTFILLFQEMLQKCLWNEFRAFLLSIVDFLDVHPTKTKRNSFVRCLRYAFSQKIELTQIDNGLSTILFPHYQWKYPLLSFFIIEALIRFINIQDYLNKNEIKTYLWRTTSFFPFLRLPELRWVLQQYYQIALRLNKKVKFKKYIFSRCRKLINFFPLFKRNNYYLKHLKILQNDRLIEVILMKACTLQDYLKEQNGVKLSNFNASNECSHACVSKIQKYHENAMNSSITTITKSFEELMRLKLEQIDND